MKTSFFLIPVILCLVPGGASASGIATNGGAPTADQFNAWFLGPEPVEYCVQTQDISTPGFGVGTRAEARRMVRESLDAWIAFFRKYGLDKLQFGPFPGNRSLGLALEFREVEKCTKSLRQLRFLFGVQTAEIAEALKLQSHNFGLSYRGKYDHESYRTGGQIWVRDLPYSVDRHKHILLHELGHMFGMEHNSVYVMDENVGDFVRDAVPNYNGFGMIESPTWPYRLVDGEVVDFSAHGRKGGRFEPNFVIVFLRDLFGFPRDGFHAASLSVTKNAGPAPFWSATFTFRDEETGREQALTGQLRLKEMRSTFKGVRGPVLYTSWSCEPCRERALPFLKHLDPEPSGMEAEGSFRYGDKVFPAIFEQRKSLLVRAFLPHVNQWWTTENYISAYYSRRPR